MIEGLVSGRLQGRPEQRSDRNGQPFVVAKMRTAPAAGDGDSLFVNVVAFAEAACTALLALEDGDVAALAGSLTPKVWTDREGTARPALDMVATQVLTAYHVSRKRDAMTDDA